MDGHQRGSVTHLCISEKTVSRFCGNAIVSSWWRLTSCLFYFLFVKVAEFRKGNYRDQTDHVKKAWLFSMMELMSYVNTAWARVDIKRTKKLWSATTPSDEALVGWYLICYVDEWTKEVEDEHTHYTTEQGTRPELPRRFKRRVEHYSRTKLFKFVQLEKDVKSLRAGTRDWDDAVAEEVERLYSKKADKSTVRERRRAVEGAFDLPELRLGEYILDFPSAEV